MVQYFPEITGSLTINGSLSVSGPMSITGSIAGTSSLASNALLLSGTGSVGFATTGAFTATSSSLSSRTTQIESVYATTGSNSFRATQSITGSLTVTGQIIAQTLNVQQVTSSIVYSSGSNVFGCDINSRQTFTGSFYQTGSVAFFGSSVGIGTTTPCNLMHIRSAITGDVTLARFTNSPGTGNEGAFIGFETGYVCGLSLIGARREGAEDDASIIFSPMLNQASCERMRITSAGRLGIGIASPQAQLDIYQVGGPLTTSSCNALLLRAGGNSDNFCHNQILFGYNGSGNYAHAIRTRHNSNGTCDNAIDFYTWRCGDAITTPAGQYVMTIAGDGRLGIGTCVPLTLLDARCAAPENCNGSVLNSHPISTFVVNASGGGQRGLQIGGPTGGVVSPVFLKVFGTGNRLSILNESNCENLIVTSGGTVTKPFQPAFQVHRGQGADCIITNTAEQRITFECIRFDIGSNTSNSGLFRAPLCGRYAFSSTVRYDGASNDNSYLRLYFAINGCSGCPAFTYGHVIAGPGSYSTSYYGMSISAVLNLNVGDCVTVNGGLNSGTVGVQFESQFSGYFLG
jgi:hypothetical protein